MSGRPLKEFLLHEDVLVRDSVAFHFFESFARDEELASLVLEACRRYGEEATLNLLSFACRFPLSARGLVEAVDALAESHPPFVEQWVSMAPLDLVQSRADLVRIVVSFRTAARLSRRESFRKSSPLELFRRLEALCRKLDARTARPGDWDEREDLLEALAIRERADAWVETARNLDGVTSPHLRSALVELVGSADVLEPPIHLVALLGSLDEGIARVAMKALVRQGHSSTAEEILERYPRSSRRFRSFALRVLSALKLDASERALHAILEGEEDPRHRGRIFDGLRFYFSDASAALLRRELESSTSIMIPREIRKALYVFDRLSGTSDPSLQSFRAELDARGEAEVYFHIPFLDPSGSEE